MNQSAIVESSKGGSTVGIATAVIGTVFGLLALYIFLAHLGGRTLPLVSDDRTAFIALGVVGIIMCAFGIQTILHSTGWLSPGTFIGAVVGILILIAFILALMNRPMFLFPTYRAGFIALGIAILFKWCVSTISLIYSLVAK